MLSFEAVEIGVGDHQLFKIDQLELKNGVVGLVGRNGAGKSTLLRTIVGLHTDFRGKISLYDRPIETYKLTELAKSIAIVYTKPQLFGKHSAREVLSLGRLPHQNMLARKEKRDIKIIDEVVDMLNLSEIQNREFNLLSDGEKQMVMVGRALVQKTDVLLLDEPGAFLDVVNRRKLMGFIRKIAESTGKLILFSTHQIHQLPVYCDTVLLINENKVQRLDDTNAFVPFIEKAFQITAIEQ